MLQRIAFFVSNRAAGGDRWRPAGLALLLVLLAATASALGAADERLATPMLGAPRALTGPQAMEPEAGAKKDIARPVEAAPATPGVAVPATTELKSTVFAPTFVRLEQDDVAWSLAGSWSSFSVARASGGSHARSANAGDTAQLSFSGTWVSVGLVADRFSGEVEVFLDGVSQGVFDLYRREETPVRLRFDGLPNAPHTVSLTVTGTANPFAANSRVQLDYADYGDGSLLANGDFEEDDARLLTSNGWSAVAYAGASGGQYLRSSTGTAWFPFAGDSFSLQALAYTSGGKAMLTVDGVYLDTIDLYAPVFASAAEPRVFSYQGFGAGHHVLQLVPVQDNMTIDLLTTPGSAPFVDPGAPVSGVARIEADDPAVLYNGLSYTRTADSWVRVANTSSNRASSGEAIYSAAPGDTVQFDFDGDWLGVGFLTDRFGGQAEVAIDGQMVETVDLYTRVGDTASRYFRELGAGAHSVTITVLGTAHAASSGARVYLDFLEVWDGAPLSEGGFEDDDGRLFYSRGWSRTAAAGASGGAYAASGVVGDTTVWFPFTGDSVTWQGWTRFNRQDVAVRIDGVSLGLRDLYAFDEGPRSFSFAALGPGPHVLELRQYRDDAVAVDAFVAPAIGPPDAPPADPAIVRLEEDDPAMRFNGEPYRTMPQSWSEQGTLQVSRGYHLASSTPGDRWSLEFEGAWLNLGFRSGGTVEVFVDGVSQGSFDTAGGVNDVRNLTFGGLAPGSHTVEAVVMDGAVRPDYIDVWNGAEIPDAWYDALLENETSGLVHLSRRQWWVRNANDYAVGGNYLSPFASADTNLWFTFTGTDLTVLGYQREATSLQVAIDGVDRGSFDLSPAAPFSPQPLALHFNDLGAGAHVVQVYTPASGTVTPRIDAFEVDPGDNFSFTPEIEWFDTTAQESLPGAGNTGFASTVAVGDLDGDGVVELVAPGLNGRLYVYRGDGQDAGSGSPIRWTSDLVGPAAEPALADLDGNGLAEIVLTGRDGTFAFHHDGQVLWSNPAVASYNAAEDLGWGGPSIANLDLDPEPEIVISALDDALYVLDHLGNVLFSDPLPGATPTVPVLADITGDGVLDIVVAQGWTLKVIDFFNGGTVAWSRDLPDPIVVLGGAGTFGAPAVADLDADARPEIIINWGHVVEALEDDGSVLWRYETNRTDLYRPSPVTVADVTGDGTPNLVTASAINAGFIVQNHLLTVLDAGGSLVWEQEVADSTASASGVAAQDLTGNGAWEILWNGSADGFLVFNGPDGKRLYNEPYTGSGTVLDYPTLADVDGDRQAEVIVAGANGLFVIGHTGRWVDSRPIWNQHSYHINNINGDWSLPFTEENSWEAHNTYRTQTPDRDPGCVLAGGVPVAPRIVELSPEPGAVLPSGAPLVISGRVIPVGPAQPLRDVLIGGGPVDVLDASGSFFAMVQLDAGANSFEVRAQDGCGEALLTLSLNGGGDGDDPWADLADASVLLEGRFAATTFDSGNDRLLVDVQAVNDGSSVPGPVLMTVGNDADPAVGLLNADGFTPQGEPYVVVIPEGETLAPGALSATRELAFSNSARRPIDFTPRWIAPVNQPPYFTSVPENRATAGKPWTYGVGVADGNGDSVNLALASAPTGMLLQDETLSWTPALTGNFEVVIAADDGRGATARQGFAVRVEDGAFNSPPVFITSPPTQRPIGAAYAYAAQASDLDGDPLTFSLQAAPAGVTVDPISGAVAWAAAESGQHSLVLVADDGRGGQASQAWTLYVGQPALTLPGPAFSSVPTTFAAVGVQYRYPWRVTSGGPQSPTVSLSQGPARMDLDAVAGELTWVPGGPDLGTHVVELLAVDAGGQEALQRFELQVLPELPNQPPYFVSAPELTARIASAYAYAPEAIDPEFEALTWSLETAPAGMTVDPATGAIAWVPDGSQPSEVPVTVRAEDPRGGVASQAFIIRLRSANAPPQITTAPPTTIPVGAFYSARIQATDADGDPLAYRLLEGPPGMTLHASLGWLHWTTTGGTPGTYSVRLEATDGWGGRDELVFDLDLVSDDQAPQVAIRMARDPACRGEAVAVCVDASDNVGLASVGLTIDGASRALDASRCHLWTPADSGLYPALADAVDPSGQTAQASTSLTVADCNDEQAPVVTLVSPLPGSTHDAPVPIVATIDDNTPAVLTWTVSLRNAETDASEVVATGTGAVTDAEVARFDPTVLQSGDYFVDILAEDGAQSGGLAVPLSAGTGAKPGRVAFTLQDLGWQLGAFPLVIGRAYDSLDAGLLGDDGGDFGPGWRLVLAGSVTDSAADAPPGSAGFAAFSAEPFTSQTRINVVKPDGERVGFTFDPQPKSFPAVFQFDVRFAPDPGVTDTLRAVDGPDTVSQLGAGFADYVIPYNPSLYELETEQGMVYVISETEGLVEVRDPQGGVLTAGPDGWQSSWGARVDYERNASGEITAIALIDEDGTTELGRLTYTYDPAGNLAGATDLAGGVSTFEYDDPDWPHHVTAMFDPLGNPIARMVFDGQGRMVAHCPGDADPVTLAGCSTFQFVVDGSSETVIDPRGFQSQLFYDDAGLLTVRRDEIEVGVFVEQSWRYDDAGREVEYVDADGGVTLTTWDEQGRRTSLTEPDGRGWTWTWGDCDGADEWLERCDALDNCTEQVLDSACRVERRTDPVGGAVVFEYDARGLRSGTIDPAGERIGTTFDARGQLQRFTDALGGAVTTEFGDFGQIVAETERDGVRRSFAYDEGVRVSAEAWQGPGVGASGITWSSDAAGLTTALTWGDATVDVTYAADGSVRRMTHRSATAPDWWIEYGYDASGNVTRLEDSFGGVTEYDYNGLNQLVEVRQSGTGVLPKRVVLEHSNTGVPVRLARFASLDGSQPGPITELDYGCASCPTTLSRIAHRRAEGSLIEELLYQRNVLHQVVGLTDGDGAHGFAYDGRGWLIAADHPPGFATGDQGFTWDGAGNWLTRTGDFGGANAATLGYQEGQGGHRLLADGLHTYDYDARGGLVERTGPGGRLVIERDGRGNAVTVTEFDAGDQVLSTASYLYSSAQQRVRAERDGVVRHYVFDGPNPIIALDDAGQVVWRQLHLRGPDRPLALEIGGELRWLLADHIGSVRQQVDNAGQSLAGFRYDAFGRQLAGPSATLDDPVRYTGRDFDLPGGLGYFRLRLYDPAIGRFLSDDGVEPWHYRYADNDPLGRVDPSGATSALEYAILICDDIVGAVVSPSGSGEQAAVVAAFQGDVRALLSTLAANLSGNVLPCGASVQL